MSTDDVIQPSPRTGGVSKSSNSQHTSPRKANVVSGSSVAATGTDASSIIELQGKLPPSYLPGSSTVDDESTDVVKPIQSSTLYGTESDGAAHAHGALNTGGDQSSVWIEPIKPSSHHPSKTPAVVPGPTHGGEFEPSDHGGDRTDDEDETEEVFVKVSTAQQRMGAILGSSDDGETIQMRADDNILYFAALYACLIPSPVIVQDDEWSPWLLLLSTSALWIYFYIVPARMRWKRITTFKALFGVVDEVDSGLLFDWIPNIIPLCMWLHSVCFVCVIYVWKAELPGIPREGSQFYTAKIQEDPSWPTQSPENAAQVAGSYVLAHPMTLLAGGIILLYVSTRMSLAPRGRAVLKERLKFLGRYHTTRGTGRQLYKLIDNLEHVARTRVVGRWTFPKFLLMVSLSLINAFVPFIFQSRMISMGFQTAPGLIMIYACASVVAGFPGCIVACLALDFVTTFYAEAAEWMNQLRFIDLDLTDITDLLFWQELRSYYLRWVIPVNYACAQTGFGVTLIGTLVIYSAMVLMVFLNGIHILFVPGVQMAWFIAAILSVYLIQVLFQATEVWDMQQSHILLLNDVVLKLRFRQALTATPALQQYTQQYRLDEVTQGSAERGERSQAHQGISSISIGKSHAAAHENSVLAIDLHGGDSTAPIGSPSKVAKGRGEPSNSISSLRRRGGLNDHRYSHAYLESMVLAITQQITAIETQDPAPCIFGIYVKPTLLRVIGGYVISACAVIVSKFFAG